MTIFCPECGLRISDRCKYCPRCGIEIAKYLIEDPRGEATLSPSNISKKFSEISSSIIPGIKKSDPIINHPIIRPNEDNKQHSTKNIFFNFFKKGLERLKGMILIEGDEFKMGNDYGMDDEKPARRIWVDSFYIKKYPISNKDYNSFVMDTKYDKPSNWSDGRFNNPDQPVCGINWEDAIRYCNWLSEKKGLEKCYYKDSNKIKIADKYFPNWECDFTKNGYRLPTEAEWEMSARGGGLEGDDYPWGDIPPDATRACFGKDESTGAPSIVGQFLPNEFGLCDMAGSVSEWCNDWYLDSHLTSSKKNPTGPSFNDIKDMEVKYKVLKGGSWKSKAEDLRCSKRFKSEVNNRNTGFGFRICHKSDE